MRKVKSVMSRNVQVIGADIRFDVANTRRVGTIALGSFIVEGTNHEVRDPTLSIDLQAA